MFNENMLNVVSLNVRGMRDYAKRKLLYNYFHKQKADVIMLQETHNSKEVNTQWETQFGGKIFNSFGNSNARGVAILLTRKIYKKASVTDVKGDNEGRFIMLTLEIEKQVFTMVNIYGHNKDAPGFFEYIDCKLNEALGENIIIGGDFNLVMDLQADSKNRNDSQPKSREKMIQIMDKYSLNDIWRVMHPTETAYTWYKLLPTPIFSRLDMFVISMNLTTCTESIEIIPRIKTDHFGVKLKIRLDEYVRGPGVWRFNASHLGDEKFVNDLTEIIKKATITASALNPAEKWEFIKNPGNRICAKKIQAYS